MNQDEPNDAVPPEPEDASPEAGEPEPATPGADAEVTEETALTILLVDDHEVVRKGLRLLLEKVLGYEVVEASSALQALAVVDGRRPDLVLLDARMPEHDGVWALERILELAPNLPVIMLSTYDSADYVDGALEGGAAGYLLKDASSHQLREAVEIALEGRGVYLHPAVAQRALARRRGADRLAHPLSERELEVLARIALGDTNEEIAAALVVSEKTVKSHLSSIFRKLGVSNRTEAASKAIRERLVDLGDS
ncbi:MAG: response regulator [Nitriliruptorales bacterium]